MTGKLYQPSSSITHPHRHPSRYPSSATPPSISHKKKTRPATDIGVCCFAHTRHGSNQNNSSHTRTQTNRWCCVPSCRRWQEPLRGAFASHTLGQDCVSEVKEKRMSMLKGNKVIGIVREVYNKWERRASSSALPHMFMAPNHPFPVKIARLGGSRKRNMGLIAS